MGNGAFTRDGRSFAASHVTTAIGQRARDAQVATRRALPPFTADYPVLPRSGAIPPIPKSCVWFIIAFYHTSYYSPILQYKNNRPFYSFGSSGLLSTRSVFVYRGKKKKRKKKKRKERKKEYIVTIRIRISRIKKPPLLSTPCLACLPYNLPLTLTQISLRSHSASLILIPHSRLNRIRIPPIHHHIIRLTHPIIMALKPVHHITRYTLIHKDPDPAEPADRT